MVIRAEILIPAWPAAEVRGRALNLVEPISFWGGVSPVDGRLTDPRSVRHDECIAGRVLLIRELRGSSSGSSILLELIRRGLAPTAIVLAAADAILALGVFVGREMQWPTPAVLRLAGVEQDLIPDGAAVVVGEDGELLLTGHGPAD